MGLGSCLVKCGMFVKTGTWLYWYFWKYPWFDYYAHHLGRNPEAIWFWVSKLVFASCFIQTLPLNNYMRFDFNNLEIRVLTPCSENVKTGVLSRITEERSSFVDWKPAWLKICAILITYYQGVFKAHSDIIWTIKTL